MIVSINQPAYLPWLGYFDRIMKSDLHVVLDHVQFEKNSVINRNKVRTPDHWAWLSVPVLTKGSFGDLAINKIKINKQMPWRRKHLNTLKSNYRKSSYFCDYVDYFEELYSHDWDELNSLVGESTKFIRQELGIHVEQVQSSDLCVNSKKSDLVLEICQRVGANKYLSGPFGRDYLDIRSFEDAGIELLYHDYPHPTYKQAFDGFEPYMCILDLLFNHGATSLEILGS